MYGFFVDVIVDWVACLSFLCGAPPGKIDEKLCAAICDGAGIKSNKIAAKKICRDPFQYRASARFFYSRTNFEKIPAVLRCRDVGMKQQCQYHCGMESMNLQRGKRTAH
jgi:hypothetical protein